jgi:Replication protein
MAKLVIKRENAKNVLMKKQWAKYVSKGIALSLMKFNPDSLLFKSYKNSSYCCEVLETNELAKIKTSYCKNRWCGVCNRIKTARLINSYLPQLEQLQKPVFVTLTLPTCTGEELPNRILEMETVWKKIYDLSIRSKYKRTFSLFKGIRKAECTIRPNDLYHYHFHFILDEPKQGEWLISRWLHYFPQADRKAQDIRIANEGAFKELFKYAFKAEVKTSNEINAKRYDLVFTALRGKRTYQAFGGIKAIDENFKDEDLNTGITLVGHANKIFIWCIKDWYDKFSGLGIVGKEIPKKVKNMVEYPTS